MPSQLAPPARKSVQDRIYESLSKRLEPIEKKLSPEDQVELDGIASTFAEDVAGAFRVCAFFGKLK